MVVVAVEADLEAPAEAWAAGGKTEGLVGSCTREREVAAADTAEAGRGSSSVYGYGFENWDEKDSEGAAETHVAGGIEHHLVLEAIQKASYA